MNKTVCIYHSIDLDGWMSAAIVKYWFNQQEVPNKEGEDCNTIDFIGYNYGQPIPDLSEYERVIMCDISFPAEIMGQMAFEKSSNFIWIDHHISAINDYEKLHKEFNEKHNLNQKYPEGLRNTKFAACELTWLYFMTDQNKLHFDDEDVKNMPEIIRLLGMYDSFRHKGTDEEQKILEFQYGARQCISNYEEAYDYLIRSKDDKLHQSGQYFDNVINQIYDSGKAIYKYLCTDAKQAYKNGFQIELKEPVYDINSVGAGFAKRKFICINKERFNPINFGINYHEGGYDGCACFYRRPDGKWSFSLYNDNGNVDCSVIAKQFGGGGHRGASGFTCDDNVFFNLINN